MRFIDEHRDRFGGVESICRVLTAHGCSITPATYYAARRRPPSARAVRDACATFLKAKKVDILVIRDILGHSQLSVTADLYTHVLAPELREAIDKMDAMLGAGSGDS